MLAAKFIARQSVKDGPMTPQNNRPGICKKTNALGFRHRPNLTRCWPATGVASTAPRTALGRPPNLHRYRAKFVAAVAIVADPKGSFDICACRNGSSRADPLLCGMGISS